MEANGREQRKKKVGESKIMEDGFALFLELSLLLGFEQSARSHRAVQAIVHSGVLGSDVSSSLKRCGSVSAGGRPMLTNQQRVVPGGTCIRFLAECARFAPAPPATRALSA